ncbi:nucleoside monophosphate kinase [Dactylosporangium sp. NPDC000244]|uniref:adenylate kinase family protein n=1 Tax=Dactylosporangium sp. NPDC000244 TaxID=3154365 RepID=UPI0033168BC1
MRVLMVAPPGAGKGTQGAVIAEHFHIQRVAIGDLLRQGLEEARAAGGGYVLDGIPRTMAQALAAYRVARSLGMTADVALHLRADDDELMRRLLKRAVVEHRADDTEPVIRQRLKLYREVTAPVLTFYARRGILLDVDATRSVEAVSADVLAALEARAGA